VKILSIATVLALSLSLKLLPAQNKTWTDPAVAKEEDPAFSVQGEYAAEGRGLQVVALGGGQFRLSSYEGGLPGAGWNGGAPSVTTGDAAAVAEAGEGLKRLNRKSETLGRKAPEGAVVLFAEGGDASHWVKGRTEAGLLVEGTSTNAEFGDFELHLEFRLPYKPEAAPGSQDRGNSGIYVFNRYECQVLDSFGNDYVEANWPDGRAPSRPNQWCGSFYKTKTPDVPMCLPPLVWQTYDIDFTAPRFDDEGKKTANARATVRLNGVVVHDDFELKRGTGAGAKRAEVARGPIYLQGHGNPVRFRNVWIQEKQ